MYNYSCRVCGESSRFIFQWYSEKENSKPVLERRPCAERGVCADFSHMIEIIVNDTPYGDFPQRLVDIETQVKNYPDILDLVERAVITRKNPEMVRLFLKQGQEALERIPGLRGKVE